MEPGDVVSFWRGIGEAKWYVVDPALDADIRSRFESAWVQAGGGALESWEATPESTLALLILLDQFARNMFRGSAKSFSTDEQARGVARRAIARDFDLKTPEPMREFFYTPIMHSEHLADQDWCVALIGARLGKDSKNYPFALSHREQIVRFGRFPARNEALGRISTPEELEFLKQQAR
jgi:uncharacterized protein (DUF924 family)